MTQDPFVAMEDLISLGIDRILTSGQQENARTGAPLIKDLISRANGRIILMPGKGVKEDNLQWIAQETGASEFHVHLDKVIKSGMDFLRDDVKMGRIDLSEQDIIMTDWEKVATAKGILNGLGTTDRREPISDKR
jgi:copper homeostasis protein